jgi:hypothetical protein
MVEIINPFINNQSENRSRIESGITEFENRILSIKREINTLEELIEINAYYSDKETDNFLYID